MAVATPLTKFSASPALPVIAAMFLLPSLAVFLGAGNNAPSHKPKQIKIVAVSYCEGIHSSLLPNCERTNLAQQECLQGVSAVAQNISQPLSPEVFCYNDCYDGVSGFFGEDVVSNLSGNFFEFAWYWRFPLTAAFFTTCVLMLFVPKFSIFHNPHH